MVWRRLIVLEKLNWTHEVIMFLEAIGTIQTLNIPENCYNLNIWNPLKIITISSTVEAVKLETANGCSKNITLHKCEMNLLL